MPRKYRRYYDDDYYYRRRRGFWSHLKRYVLWVIVTASGLLAGLIIIELITLASNYQAQLRIVFIVLALIGGVLLLFVILKFIVGQIAAMITALSEARARAIQTKKAKIDLSKRVIARDVYRQRMMEQAQRPTRPAPIPQPSQPQQAAPVAPPFPQDKLVRVLPRLTVPLQPAQKSEVPGMPEQSTVYYRDVQNRVKPGELVTLVRENGSPRIETWDAFKVLLVLGSSSSGKTNTITEKTLGFVSGSGLIVPCDAHENKADSLFKKIYPLEGALYPGAVFAVSHTDILQNMRLVRSILEERIQPGADCSTPVLLIVEELNRLLRDKAIAKEVALILEILGEEGRGYNVFVIIGCQKVTYLSDIRKSCISFIVHRSDESEAEKIIPSRYAKYCPELQNGQCFVKDANGKTEPGLQVLVTRKDIELAGIRLSHQRPIQARPTVKLDQYPPQESVPSSPPVQRSTRLPPRPAGPGHTPRPVHKTRLQPAQPSREETEHTPNPLHTWSGQPAHEKPEEKKTGPVSPSEPSMPPSPKPAQRNTEELSLSHLSPEKQMEILALLRKKKSQKEKEN